MHINRFSIVYLSSIFLSLCLLSSLVQAFQHIDKSIYFPNSAQGHSQSLGHCERNQLMMSSNTKIYNTKGIPLDFCSSNKGEGLPKNSCDNGLGGYKTCEITKQNVPALPLPPFKKPGTAKYTECNSGALTLNEKDKFTSIEIQGTCHATIKTPSKEARFSYLEIIDSAKVTLTSGDYWIQYLSITGNQPTLEIVGDVRLFVNQELSLSGKAKIIKAENSSLTIISYSSVKVFDNSFIEGDIYAKGKIALSSSKNENELSYISGRVSSKSLHITGESYIEPLILIEKKIDHFEFLHAKQSSTCSTSTVTLRACANAKCSELFTDDVSMSLNVTNDGYWKPSNKIKIKNGYINLSIGKPTQGNVTLGIESALPHADNPLLCKTKDGKNSNCDIHFNAGGFTIDVPDKLANRSVTATIKGCGNNFNGTKEIQVWSDYIEPNALKLIGAPRISATEGNKSWKNIGATKSSATTLRLNFENNEATFQLNYPDAGKLQLNASHSLTPQHIIKGDDEFVSFPARLTAYVSKQNSSTPHKTCSSEDINCAVFAQAGELFALNVKAHAWSDNNASIGRTTPNYTQQGLKLTHELIAPSALLGGKSGELFANTYNHTSAKNSLNAIQQSISEVGVFKFLVTPPSSYLGSTAYTIKSASTSSIGRFTPAYFSVSAEQPTITNACHTYTYMGQTFKFDDEPTLNLVPLSYTGQPIQNYNVGKWWRYENEWALRSYTALPSKLEVVDTDSNYIANRREGFAEAGNVVRLPNSNGVQLQGAELRYNKPFTPHSPTQDVVTLALMADDLKDSDGVCYKSSPESECLPYDFPATPEHRQEWGRITMADTHGSELAPLESTIITESYIAGRFEKSHDNCTTLKLSDFTFNVGTDPKNLPVGDGYTTANLSNSSMNNGLIRLKFSPPGNGNQGEIIVTLFLLGLPWLQQGADQSDSFEDSLKTIIHFGIYRGSDRIIWKREQVE